MAGGGELSSFVTSWIPTTAAAVTRAQDNCAIPPASISASWFAATGSWLAEFYPLTNGAGNNPRIIGVIAGAMAVMYTNTSSLLSQYDGVASMSAAGTMIANSITKAAITWAPGAAKACLNAGAVATAATLTSGYYSNINSFGVTLMGTTNAPEVMSGYLRRVNYWPRALSDAEMRQVTT